MPPTETPESQTRYNLYVELFTALDPNSVPSCIAATIRC